MSIFLELVRFELKKIFCRKQTIIVLALAIAVAAFSAVGTVIGGSVSYIDESGNEMTISRYADDMLDRKNGEALSGRVIDADLIMEAVDAYKKIPLEGNHYTASAEYQKYARKYSEIYNIVRRALSLSGVEEFQNLTCEQAERFDEMRRENRKQAIENDKISERVKEYWQDCLDRAPETLTYEYSGGYYRYLIVMSTTAILAGAALANLLSGIFSCEYTSGADSLILSSKHGKGLVIGAKLFVAFTVAVLLMLLLMLISFAETGMVWGSGGGDAFLELLGEFPYPLTIGQSAAIYSLCFVSAGLFVAALTAVLSAYFKTPFHTVVVMAVLLIAPMFLEVSDAPAWAYELFALLPSNMAVFGFVMGEYPFELFGMVIPNYVFLPVFALAATCLCAYLAYRGFGNHPIDA